VIAKQQFWGLTQGHEFLCHPYPYAFIGLVQKNLYRLSKVFEAGQSWDMSMIFDINTDEVIEISIDDFSREVFYCLKNPKYKRYEDMNVAKTVELETDEDFLEKASAIIDGREYDSRVSIPLEMPDDELLMCMKLAHEEDITFNHWVERAVKQAIERVNSQEKISE